MLFSLEDRLKEAPMLQPHLVIKCLTRRLLSHLALVTWENPNNNVYNKWQTFEGTSTGQDSLPC